MDRQYERGNGRVGFLLALILVGCAIFAGIKVIPVRVAALEFSEVLRDEARYASVRASNSEVSKRIMAKAADMDLPLEKKNLKIRRTSRQITIEASYEIPIDLKLTTYVYKFNGSESAPLF